MSARTDGLRERVAREYRGLIELLGIGLATAAQRSRADAKRLVWWDDIGFTGRKHYREEATDRILALVRPTESPFIGSPDLYGVIAENIERLGGPGPYETWYGEPGEEGRAKTGLTARDVAEEIVDSSERVVVVLDDTDWTSSLARREEVWHGDELRIDFDTIAWRMEPTDA